MNIIATCGTSIIMNNKRNLNVDDSISNEALEKLIGESLASKELSHRDYGAEINALINIKESKDLSIDKIFLIVSDTDSGRMSGSLIKQILVNNSLCKGVEVVEIPNLNNEKQHDFAKKGLKNLTQKVIQIINQNNFYTDNLIMLPLGGFKAQISMVGIIAQLFAIKTYYMFESFNEVIELMPLPISFDNSLFINYSDFFLTLNAEGLVEKTSIESYLQIEPKLKNLIEEEKIDKIKYVSLSAIGQAFYDKLSMDNKCNLPKASKKSTEEKRKSHICKGNEAHAQNIYNTSGFQSFLTKLYEIEYVENVIMNGNSLTDKGNQVFINKSGNSQGERVLHCKYNTTKGASGMIEMDIYLTENSEDKIDSALIDIKERLVKQGITIGNSK